MYFLLKYIKKNFYFISLFIILATFTNAFYFSYAIVKRPYEERLMWNYGFECEKYSYGFVNEIVRQHIGNQPLTIINLKNMPNIQYLFHRINFDKSKQNLILLNLKDQNELKKYNIDLSQYYLVENLDNCYFYKKND